MGISSLYFTDVGPFEEITLEFDDQVNVFTGPNNSGKSTVLWALGELLVYPFSIPGKFLRSDHASWKLKYATAGPVQELRGNFPSDLALLENMLSEIGFTCFIPAQRHSSGVRPTGTSPASGIEDLIDAEMQRVIERQPEVTKDLGVAELRRLIRERGWVQSPDLTKRRTALPSYPTMVSDAAVIQRIVDLDYAAYRKKQPAIRETIESVFMIASEIVQGFPMEFLEIVDDELTGGMFLQMKTASGTVPLDTLSQGTQSLVHSLARCILDYADFYDFPADLRDKPGILIIDEIDAHLHPSWQRRVIPTITSHFPNLQIFCSTHSPLMLAGLREGQVHLLKLDEHGEITVSRNELDIIGWTADEILRNFLDVPNPTDMMTASHITRLQELRRQETLSDTETQELEQLRQTISRELLLGPREAQAELFEDELRKAQSEQIP